MIYVRPIYVLLAATLIGLPPARAGGRTTPTLDQPHPIENPVASVSLDQLAATRERPLFAPDRRRPAVAAVVRPAAAPPPPPEPPKLSLFGVVVDGDGPRAVFRAEPAGKTMHARLGDEIGGWRVTRIDERRLVISLDDRSVAVTMFASPNTNAQVARVRPPDRVFEVNAAGVLRSHRIHKSQ